MDRLRTLQQPAKREQIRSCYQDVIGRMTASAEKDDGPLPSERTPSNMDIASYQHLKLERQDDGVLLVTLNRPDVLNAAHEQMHRELATVWTDISRDEQTRVAVVTGAGRAFSAAADLAMVERQIGHYAMVT